MKFADFQGNYKTTHCKNRCSQFKTNSNKKSTVPSLIRETELYFRSFLDKLEQAEIVMKLKETENLKFQKVTFVQTITSLINDIKDCDYDLAVKNLSNPKYLEKEAKF